MPIFWVLADIVVGPGRKPLKATRQRGEKKSFREVRQVWLRKLEARTQIWKFSAFSLTSIMCKILENLIGTSFFQYPARHSVLFPDRRSLPKSKSLTSNLKFFLNEFTWILDDGKRVEISYPEHGKVLNPMSTRLLVICWEPSGSRGQVCRGSSKY